MPREASFVRHNFDTGFTAYTLQQDVPWVRLTLFVKYAGHEYDPLGKEGTAHLLEHVLHAGTIGYPYTGYTNLQRWLDGQPFSLVPASTHPTYMGFPLIVKADALTQGLDFLFRLMFRPSFVQDIEIDREIIRKERIQNGLSSRGIRIENALARAMGWSEHRTQTANGLPEDQVLNAITLDDLKTFHQRYFHPANITLIAVGNVPREEVEQFADRSFSGKRAEYFSPPTIEEAPLAKPAVAFDRFAPNGEGAVKGVSLRYRWYYPFQHGKVDVIVRNALDQAMNHEIRERQQLTYGVGVKAQRNRHMPSCLFIHCVVSPHEEEVARKAIGTIMTDYDSLSKIVSTLTSTVEKDLCFQEKTAFDRITSAWGDLLYYGRIHTMEQDVEDCLRITPEEAIAFMRKHLDPDDGYLQIIENL